MEKKFNTIYVLLSALLLVILAQSYYLYDFKQQLQESTSTTDKSKVMSDDLFINRFFNNNNSNSSNTYEQIQKIQEEMQKSFGKFNSIFSNDPFFKDTFSHISIAPMSDFKESNNEYIIELSIPGVQKNKISINTQDNVLKIEASIQNMKDTNSTNYFHKERYVQNYMRNFVLPNDAKMNKLISEYKNGILRITIPKKK